MKKQKKSDSLTNSKQFNHSITVFLDLPLIIPSLANSYNSIIVEQLQKLGVANISVEIAKFSQLAGRLSLFRRNWEKICNDRWVLNAIQSFRIEWLTKPH